MNTHNGKPGVFRSTEKGTAPLGLSGLTPLLPYIISFSVILLTSFVCYHLQNPLGYQSVSLILLFIITLLPLFRIGVGPVLSATLLSAFIWDYFFIPPHYTLTIGRTEDTLMLLLFVIVAGVSSILSIRNISQEQIIREREEKTNALYRLSKELTEARGFENILSVIIKNIDSTFGVHSSVIPADGANLVFPPPVQIHLEITEYDRMFANWSFLKNTKTGLNAGTLPGSEKTFYPLTLSGSVMGVLVIEPVNGTSLNYDRELLLATFMHQIAVVLQSEFLNRAAQQVALVQESEKLYKNIFNSLSHELRTPLTAILSAANSLENSKIGNDSAARSSLLHEITVAAARLNNLVQNLLDMARLESGMLQPKFEWQDIKELLSGITHQCSVEYNRTINILYSGEVKPLYCDYTLIEQSCLNIIRNACLYSPENTDIDVTLTFSSVVCIITVADKGAGIPKEDNGKIFTKFYRAAGAAPGGMGLGLSITKGFIEAHNGKVTAGNREGGGTVITLTLPVTEGTADEA